MNRMYVLAIGVFFIGMDCCAAANEKKWKMPKIDTGRESYSDDEYADDVPLVPSHQRPAPDAHEWRLRPGAWGRRGALAPAVVATGVAAGEPASGDEGTEGAWVDALARRMVQREKDHAPEAQPVSGCVVRRRSVKVVVPPLSIQVDRATEVPSVPRAGDSPVEWPLAVPRAATPFAPGAGDWREISDDGVALTDTDVRP